MSFDWFSAYLGFIVGGLFVAFEIALINAWFDRDKKGRAAD